MYPQPYVYSGAGKSTTINMMSTLLTPTSGISEIYGADVQKESRLVRENLLCRSVIHGIQKQQAADRLAQFCDIFSIGELLRKKYRTLSGGQKRRCEIAAALQNTAP